MTLARFLPLGLGAALLPFHALAKLPADKLDALPPAATRAIDFTKDIKPILESSCVKCHGHGKAKGGFQLDTRETFLKPADSGPAVVSGNSRDSVLIHLVSGLDPDGVMPEKGSRLTPAQVGLLRAWIDQGLTWDPAVTFARDPHRNLTPRNPDLPSPSGDQLHPIDRWMAAYFAANGVQPASPIDDRAYARRVYLDVVGLLPSPAELDAFLRDTARDKRTQLVHRLLGEDARFAQHWMTFWNDLLRNDYKGTGYIDGGREQITKWLYGALRDNRPYDQFVHELVDPRDGPARGFTKGIVWRGVVNASQTPQMQAAQNISQVFLGVNLKCASCHDSFIDDWQLADAYGMAGVYADEPLELVQCDKPLGKHAPVKFLFPELGALSDQAPKAERVARLAELLTHRANGRLSRTIVNRIWARFLGRGLVEPLDIMQNPAWNPDLLDWLAEDLVSNRYDLKHTMALVLTSQAYQLPAVDVSDKPAPGYLFKGPAVRRLTAEQFRDALAQLTGIWYEKPEGGLDSLLVTKGPEMDPPVAGAWIWADPHAADGVPPQTAYFLKTFELPVVPSEAAAFINADNTQRLWVNGREATRPNQTPWNETTVLDLRPFLKAGSNTIAIEAANSGEEANPAGLLFYARLRGTPDSPSAAPDAPPGDGAKRPETPKGAPAQPPAHLDIASDASWLATTNRFEGWQKPEFKPDGWARAQVLGPIGMAPWNLGPQFAATVAGRPIYGSVRAALVPADPLTLALGRPNREQVTSVRSPVATTIQMLELINGDTLAGVLKQGAEKLVSTAPDGADVVHRVFSQGLCRKPTASESSLGVALVGTRPTVEGVEDLLWSIAMLPEFQLVY